MGIENGSGILLTTILVFVEMMAGRFCLSPSMPAVYVCICNGVTDHQIREAADNGCSTVAELTMRTGAGANCGSCIGLAAEILEDLRSRRELALPVLAQAA